MRLKHPLVILFLFGLALLIGSPASTAEEPSCVQILNPEVVKQDSDFQRKLANYEKLAQSLIDDYTRHLYPFQDPFALVFEVEQGFRIWERLSERAYSGQSIPSPMVQINNAIVQFYRGELHFQRKVVEWLLEDARYLLDNTSLAFDKEDYQSNLLGLHYLVDYLRRYRKPDTIVNREGEPASNETTEGEPEEEKRGLQDEEVSPPGYPKLPKAYSPQTDDSGDGGEMTPKQIIAEVNFETPFFGGEIYAEIVRGAAHPFSVARLPNPSPATSRTRGTGKEMKVRTFGKKRFQLFLPSLHKPLQPTDPRATISRADDGSYIVTLEEDMPLVRVPLTEFKDKLMPHYEHIYTRPVGFRKEEWPDEVQIEIFAKFSEDQPHSPLNVAQAVADHLAKDYLYSVDAKQAKDPIAALKEGAFQCDMAAYAMVGILRDVYRIPSRVIGGFHARNRGDKSKSLLMAPDQAHVWVEVYHEGKWHIFDPTPKMLDKKRNQGDQAEEYPANGLDNTPDVEQKQAQTQTSPFSNDSGEGHDDEQSSKQMEEEENIAGGSGWGEGDEDSEGNGEEGSQLRDLSKELELGSLELVPFKQRSPLVERAARLLLRNALLPSLRGEESLELLNQISGALKPYDTVGSDFREALAVHSKDHASLKNWIGEIQHLMPVRDVNKTYHELYRLRQSLKLFSKMLDPYGRIPLPWKLAEKLEEAQARLAKLAHVQSEDIALVDEFFRPMPAVVRKLLQKDYNFSSPGPNAPTAELAKLIKSGRLNELRLLGQLMPLSDFVHNPVPRPEFAPVRTWRRDFSRTTGTDILPLKRYSDAARAIRGQPGKSLLENIREGTAFARVRRKHILQPLGHGKDDAERITLLLYDTSGSMSGNPARFQGGLISAFTANALSDVSLSGRHRHRIILIPFDADPGEPVRVTRADEAMDVIRNYQKKLANTGRSTDIHKALMQAMALIADAEQRSGEPLAAANIVLMTDGQSSIDVDELSRARQSIDRLTPLQIMFIAINQTNEELARFANEYQSIGFNKGMYREFTEDLIADILAEADTLNFEADESSFYTDTKPEHIDSQTYALLDEAQQLAARFLKQIAEGTRFVSAKDHFEELRKLEAGEVRQIDRPLARWLNRLRRFMDSIAFKDQNIRELIADDLLTHFEALTGVSLNELSEIEQEQLRHFISEAGAMSAEERGKW